MQHDDIKLKIFLICILINTLTEVKCLLFFLCISSRLMYLLDTEYTKIFFFFLDNVKISK